MVNYIWFTGSFFIAVGILWIFCFSTGWRMLNALLVSFTFSMFFFCYPFTVSGFFHDAVQRVVPSFVPSSLIPSLFYLVFSGLCFLTGLGVFLKRKITHTGLGALYG
jgi:hypothetical protein